MSSWQQQQQPAEPEYEIPGCSSDTVSCISVGGSRVAASSWAGDIRLWELSGLQGIPRASVSYPTPLLTCAFNTDFTRVMSGGADGLVRVWDVATGASQEAGKHDLAVKTSHWIPAVNLLVTGSWDRTVRMWDMRTPNPAFQLNLAERVYASDCVDNFLLVGAADKSVQLFDLTSRTGAPLWAQASPLRLETRCLGLLPSKLGFAICTSEARCAMQYFHDENKARNFSFKCHRDKDRTPLAYPVHEISFHKTFGSFATAGGDGTFVVWDHVNRTRLCTVKLPDACRANAITAGKFTDAGDLYVYASGYDWTKGADEYERNVKNNPNRQPRMWLHRVKEDEVRPKAK